SIHSVTVPSKPSLTAISESLLGFAIISVLVADIFTGTSSATFGASSIISVFSTIVFWVGLNGISSLFTTSTTSITSNKTDFGSSLVIKTGSLVVSLGNSVITAISSFAGTAVTSFLGTSTTSITSKTAGFFSGTISAGFVYVIKSCFFIDFESMVKSEAE